MALSPDGGGTWGGGVIHKGRQGSHTGLRLDCLRQTEEEPPACWPPFDRAVHRALTAADSHGGIWLPCSRISFPAPLHVPPPEYKAQAKYLYPRAVRGDARLWEDPYCRIVSRRLRVLDSGRPVSFRSPLSCWMIGDTEHVAEMAASRAAEACGVKRSKGKGGGPCRHLSPRYEGA